MGNGKLVIDLFKILTMLFRIIEVIFLVSYSPLSIVVALSYYK